MPTKYIPKTKEEVEAEIKLAEEFAKEHPYSIFGDNNTKSVKHFKRICNAYLNGRSIEKLKQDCMDDGEDIDEDDDEGMEENIFEDDIISWLAGESNENNKGHFW